jgi:pyruvate/2-oxoglutarate dehydrogenase complex dihydrolipoamide dehydrogenase (E3) component
MTWLSSAVARLARRPPSKASKLTSRLTLPDLMARKDQVIATEIDVVHQQLSRNKIEILQGPASFVGPQTLTVARSKRPDYQGPFKDDCHRETHALLGVHIIGAGATELIHIGQSVLTYGGTVEYFVHNVFNYPTMAECYRTAALDGLNRLHHPRSQ